MSSLSLEDVYEILEQSAKDRLVLKVKKANSTIKTVMLRKEKMSNEENIVKFCLKRREKDWLYFIAGILY